ALLRRPDLPEEALTTLEGMVGTLDHLGAMIEQMLALARMEDPSRGLNLQALGVDLLVSEAVAPFRSLAEEKGISLRMDTDALATLKVDATLARRAIHNLLANAIRHSEGGGCVCVKTRREDGTAIIAVEDTGGGIPGDLLSRVGQRFLKGETQVDQRGSGLGLVIVKKIMELHGGSLRLTSRLDQGTLAELQFPES
ncbi:MAG: HAMP domain-containing histidine kinase, partial [Patescibacteria group bacterium]|nr:HAMP domain-containing histidine kinase [Patescibacteria group bacterium]